MKVLRWMFTKEGSARTPILSAVSTSLIVGLVAGGYFWLRESEGWGIAAGVLMASVFFGTIFPTLRKEHEKQRNVPPGQFVVHLPIRDRLASARPSLIRFGILLAAIPVGFALSLIIGSVWGLVIAMLAAFVLVTFMRRIGSSRG